MQMGQKNQMYFNKDLNRWVLPGQEEAAALENEARDAPPPVQGMASGSGSRPVGLAARYPAPLYMKSQQARSMQPSRATPDESLPESPVRVSAGFTNQFSATTTFNPGTSQLNLSTRSKDSVADCKMARNEYTAGLPSQTDINLHRQNEEDHRNPASNEPVFTTQYRITTADDPFFPDAEIRQPSAEYFQPPAKYSQASAEYTPPPAEYYQPPAEYTLPDDNYTEPHVDYEVPYDDYTRPHGDYNDPYVEYSEPPAEYSHPTANEPVMSQAYRQPDYYRQGSTDASMMSSKATCSVLNEVTVDDSSTFNISQPPEASSKLPPSQSSETLLSRPPKSTHVGAETPPRDPSVTNGRPQEFSLSPRVGLRKLGRPPRPDARSSLSSDKAARRTSGEWGAEGRIFRRASRGIGLPSIDGSMRSRRRQSRECVGRSLCCTCRIHLRTFFVQM